MTASRDISGSRILVIGGSGFIGSHLVDLLVQEDPTEIVVYDNFARGRRFEHEAPSRSSIVRVVEGDIRDMDALTASTRGVDFVFHLAALWLLQCASDPRAGLEVNVVGTYNVIEACLKAGVERLVFSSSASVYGDMLVSPMDETHPLNNRTMYGMTKIAGEQMLRAFSEMHGLDWVGLRYFNVYGPRQDHKGAYVAVLMKVLDRIDRSLPPIIYGDGTQSYDFVYVADVARSNVVALKAGVSDQCFNVASGVATSINELVSLLLELSNSNLQPEYQQAGQSFVSHRLGSVEEAERLLGFTAQTGLRDGLSHLIEWRRHHMLKPGVAER